MTRLTMGNIQEEIDRYTRSIKNIGTSIEGMEGLDLLKALKRNKINTGLYKNCVSLFEAANRIMADMVILYGVEWLLKTKTFPFDAYTVELGNEGGANSFDIKASGNGKSLVGEAFNVVDSLFPGKKSSMLGKLRKQKCANYRIIMVNDDAVKMDTRHTLGRKSITYLLTWRIEQLKLCLRDSFSGRLTKAYAMGNTIEALT
ncbi:hypothetical protein ACFLV0_07480 [Chloroflexota bacterium]